MPLLYSIEPIFSRVKKLIVDIKILIKPPNPLDLEALFVILRTNFVSFAITYLIY